MPLYEYRCQDCGKVFERLVRAQDSVVCPYCRGERLERLISLFAHPGGGSACTSCSRTSCQGCSGKVTGS